MFTIKDYPFQGGLSEGFIDAMKNINDDYVLYLWAVANSRSFSKRRAPSQIYLIPPVEHQVLLEWTSSAPRDYPI